MLPCCPPHHAECPAMFPRAKTRTLTAAERQYLAQVRDRGSDWRERRRERTVLRLDEGRFLDGVQYSRNSRTKPQPTIGSPGWRRGLKGVSDLTNSGAPRKLSAPGKKVRPDGPSVENPPVREIW